MSIFLCVCVKCRDNQDIGCLFTFFLDRPAFGIYDFVFFVNFLGEKDVDVIRYKLKVEEGAIQTDIQTTTTT